MKSKVIREARVGSPSMPLRGDLQADQADFGAGRGRRGRFAVPREGHGGLGRGPVSRVGPRRPECRADRLLEKRGGIRFNGDMRELGARTVGYAAGGRRSGVELPPERRPRRLSSSSPLGSMPGAERGLIGRGATSWGLGRADNFPESEAIPTLEKVRPSRRPGVR